VPEEEVKFGPFECTIQEVVSLLERGLERILTLEDMGVDVGNKSAKKDEHFRESIICRLTAKLAKPNFDMMKKLAGQLDAMSVSIPRSGINGNQLTEEMNLLASRIRKMVSNKTDESGNPYEEPGEET
jgi:hypothetical protein